MSLEALLVHDVTIVRATTDTDAYGDTVPDWSDTTSTTVRGRVSQRSADEVLGHRDAEVSDWRLYLEPDADVVATDRIGWNGDTYEIVGEPAPAVRRTDEVHHLELVLRKVEG